MKREWKLCLTGFMGSGKSSVAPLIALTLRIPHLDLDQLVVEQSNRKSISEIFEQDGEDVFRERETAALKGVMVRRHLILSPGGGLICSEQNRSLLKLNGFKLIYLQTSFSEILIRVKKDSSDRPLFNDLEPARALYLNRVRIYQEFHDLTVSTDQKTPQQVAREVVELLKSHPSL